MISEFENIYMSIGRNVEKRYVWVKSGENWPSKKKNGERKWQNKHIVNSKQTRGNKKYDDTNNHQLPTYTYCQNV
jgi:hypothetical protein